MNFFGYERRRNVINARRVFGHQGWARGKVIVAVDVRVHHFNGIKVLLRLSGAVAGGRVVGVRMRMLREVVVAAFRIPEGLVVVPVLHGVSVSEVSGRRHFA